MENKKTTNHMGYEDFLLFMKDSVINYTEGEYQVEIIHVIKNNSIELDGLVIMKGNERITPNIYLNSYYEEYLKGIPAVGIAKEIMDIYYDTMEEGKKEPIRIQYNMNEMKSCIIYRLISFKRNQKLLKQVPYVRFLDLAVTFHCLIKNSEAGIGTIRITNEHIKAWNTNLKEITNLARKNTPKIFPAKIQNMNDVISDILEKDKYNMEDDLVYKGSRPDIGTNEMKNYLNSSESVETNKSNFMYVLSNIRGINGASCLLYDDLIKEMAKELESDLFILPSSIHELILVKDNRYVHKNSLKDMVTDVNRTQVPEEEILSDSVYYYSRQKEAMTIL